MTEQPQTARQLLTDHGLPEDVIDGALAVHARQLAEHVRAEAARGRKSGLTRIYYRAAADMIDPQVADDPLTVLRAIEEAPTYESVPGCPHCLDGHTPPDHGQTWGAYVGPERDGDGRPNRIYVQRSGGAHVAESDAEWVRGRLNDTGEQQ